MRNIEKYYEKKKKKKTKKIAGIMSEDKHTWGPNTFNFSFITKANGKGILIWQMRETCWYNVEFIRNINKS